MALTMPSSGARRGAGSALRIASAKSATTPRIFATSRSIVTLNDFCQPGVSVFLNFHLRTGLATPTVLLAEKSLGLRWHQSHI